MTKFDQRAADLKELVEGFNEEIGSDSALFSEFLAARNLDPVKVGALSRITTQGVPEEIPLERRGPSLWMIGFAFGLYCAEHREKVQGDSQFPRPGIVQRPRGG